MALLERLAIVVQADAQGAIKELNAVGKAAERELGKAEKGAKNWGATFQKAGVGMIGAATVMGGALFKAAQASEEANKSTLLLRNTISNMPKLAGANEEAFTDLATAIQAKTAADGDAIVSGMAMLGTFNLTAKEIQGVTPLVVDYARKFGVDMTQAAIAVGKALDGQIGALKRNGVSIDENLYKTDRYAAVTAALRDQVGGFAEAEGKTFSGQLERLKNQLGDVQEGIGVGVVGALNSAIGPLTTVTEKFTSLDEETQSSIGRFATIATGTVGAIGALSVLAGTVQKVSANFHDANGNMTGFGRAATAIGKAGAVTATVYALAEATSLLLDQVHRARFGDADVSKLGSDLLKFGKDGAAAGELAREFGTDVDDLVEKLEMASKWGENSAITTGQKLELWAKGYKDAANDIDALDKALAQMVTGGNPELATAAFNRLTRGMDDKQVAAFKKQLDDWDGAKAGAKFTGELAKETEQLAEETEAGGAVLLEYEKRQKSVGDALKARTEREKDLTEQIEALYEASIAVIDAELAREKALDAVNDGTHEVNKAQQEYNDTVAKYGRNSAEALTAQDRLADATRGLKGDFLGAAGAAVRLAEDQAKARGESISAEERQRLYRTELERFASTLSPSSPLRTQLQGYIDKLNETPSVIKTEALIEWVDSRGYLNLGGGRRAMATGGRADAFQPYLTGEGGRSEIFVPDRGGFILSAKDAKDAIGGSGMTFAPSITISNPVAESSTDSIRRELRFIAHAMSVA